MDPLQQRIHSILARKAVSTGAGVVGGARRMALKGRSGQTLDTKSLQSIVKALVCRRDVPKRGRYDKKTNIWHAAKRTAGHNTLVKMAKALGVGPSKKRKSTKKKSRKGGEMMGYGVVGGRLKQAPLGALARFKASYAKKHKCTAGVMHAWALHKAQRGWK